MFVPILFLLLAIIIKIYRKTLWDSPFLIPQFNENRINSTSVMCKSLIPSIELYQIQIWSKPIKLNSALQGTPPTLAAIVEQDFFKPFSTLSVCPAPVWYIRG